MKKCLSLDLVVFQLLGGIVLWSFNYSLEEQHLLTGFLILSLWSWLERGESYLKAYYPYYLLHLSMIVSAMACESGESLWLIGQIPIFYLIQAEDSGMSEKRAIHLLSLPPLLFIVGSLVKTGPLFSWSGFVVYSFYFLWQYFKGRSNLKEELLLRDKNRYFFHDLFNHIHGLYLFLQRKSSLTENIQASEVDELIKEMKNLMSVLSDHTGQRHKNFIFSTEWEEPRFLFEDLQVLAKTYAPELRFKWTSQVDDVRGKLHRATFFRIMTNLIKNLYDHAREAGECEFKQDAEKLEICMSNKVGTSSYSGAQEIFSTEQVRSLYGNSGLDSLAYLVDKSGGEFNVSLQNNCWCTTIILPFRSQKFTAKTAA